MHFILSGLGSYGDVLPVAGLAATLSARGHRVQLAVNPYFRDVVAATGAELLPVGTIDEYERLVNHPHLWSPTRGFHVVYRYTAEKLPELVATLRGAMTPGDTIFGAHGLDFASRLISEKFGNSLATIHFAPIALCSVLDAPAFPGQPPAWMMPLWFRRLAYWIADKRLIDPFIAPPLNKLRASLGLPPVSRVFTRWASSPQRIIALFPEWFAPDPGDWPRQLKFAGFPLYDGAATHAMSDGAEQFLAAGEPPIVFAPGSANSQAREFFAAAAEACRTLGRRGMLVTKYPDQLPRSLPAGVERFGYLPFTQLLPRAAAIVHHGGIGTCAQSLAAGAPQVITPLAFDQFDNARRVERLGIGAIVPARKVSAALLAAALRPLLSAPKVEQRAREIAAQCDGQAARNVACDMLEALGQTTPTGGER